MEKEENEENNDNVNKRKSVKLEEDKQLNKAVPLKAVKKCFIFLTQKILIIMALCTAIKIY